MKITIKILPKNLTQSVEIKSGATIYDIIKKLDLYPDNIIILKNNTPVPVDDTLDNGQELTIIQVASGG
ncbi:MAG: MoaD/ThiS family protein [Thermoplasmatota archaeon]